MTPLVAAATRRNVNGAGLMREIQRSECSLVCEQSCESPSGRYALCPSGKNDRNDVIHVFQ